MRLRPHRESHCGAVSAWSCAENLRRARQTMCACADIQPEFRWRDRRWSSHRIMPSPSISRIAGIAVTQNQHGAGLGISPALEADDHAIANFFLRAQSRFQILGINVHARGSDDHFFFAALEKKIALLIERAQVAGAVPASRSRPRRVAVRGRSSSRWQRRCRAPEFRRPRPA